MGVGAHIPWVPHVIGGYICGLCPLSLHRRLLALPTSTVRDHGSRFEPSVLLFKGVWFLTFLDAGMDQLVTLCVIHTKSVTAIGSLELQVGRTALDRRSRDIRSGPMIESDVARMLRRELLPI